MPALFISDSLTLSGTIKARGPWPALTAMYRPCLADEVYEFTRAKRETGKQSASLAVSLLAKHLVSWDVTDAQGEPTAITPEVLRKLPHAYLEELVNFVTGYGPEEEESDRKN